MVSCTGAWAQSGSASDTEAAGLSEVVVTAQKRSENVQDVPATVVALGAEDLEMRDIQSLTGLASHVPSLMAGELYGTTQISLRGISTGITSGADDPSVATHINGVYQPRSRSIASALIDLDRVEVLAGPQGTLYGRNAVGGAVNYVLKGPSEEFEGKVSARVGNYSRYAIDGSVSGPLSDRAGFRITALYDDRSDGFTKVLNANAPKSYLEELRSAGGSPDRRG
jgi:iron complex outermembrane receptor protein